MEPTHSERVEYKINTKVAGVKQFDNKWWVLFDGSWEWLALDADEPEFKIGDYFTIILRKV